MATPNPNPSPNPSPNQDLYDNEDVEHRMFRSDWGKALATGGFEKFLMRMDDDGALTLALTLALSLSLVRVRSRLP